MSLVIATYVPEGIVLASDSRQTITMEGKTPEGQGLPRVETINSDHVYKTFLLSRRGKDGSTLFDVGISSFGQDLLGGMSTASHMKRFVEETLTDQDDVTTIPKKLVDFFRKSFPNADTGFHVAGYRKDGRISVPYIFACHVGRYLYDDRRNVKPDGSLLYGTSWSGQADVIGGLLQPSFAPGPDGKPLTMHKPPILWDAMALQDAIDFSIFAIRTTIDTIRFQARPKNVGGPIDVLVITPEEAVWIQRKALKPSP